jgi:hypothetical protein
MRAVANILATLVAVLAILGASGWSSSASACMYDGTANVVGGASMAMPAHRAVHQQHHAASSHKPASPASAPGGVRLDCAACVAVLPAFPSMGSHELMPFVPAEQSFEPLSGVAPALDPPPPRAQKL